MEELRSTEILDEQILQEARRKAERLLKLSEKERENISRETEEKLVKSEKLFKKSLEEKIKRCEQDEADLLPLRKKRFLISFVNDALSKAVSAYFESLTDEECATLLLLKKEKYFSLFNSKKVKIFVYGFPIDAVKKAFNGRLGEAEFVETEFNKHLLEDACSDKIKKGIIIESLEGELIRVRFTLVELLQRLMLGKRCELYQSYFGGRLATI